MDQKYTVENNVFPDDNAIVMQTLQTTEFKMHYLIMVIKLSQVVIEEADRFASSNDMKFDLNLWGQCVIIESHTAVSSLLTSTTVWPKHHIIVAEVSFTEQVSATHVL